MAKLMQRHPLSALFEKWDMKGDQFDELVQSIKKNGLLDPITTFDGQILDGWNRYLACRQAKVKVRLQALQDGLDPWELVWSKHKHRRHMTAQELVAVYAEHETSARSEAPQGGDKIVPPPPSIKTVQKDLGVSRGTAIKAAKVVRAQDPELNKALANKEVSLEKAAELASMPAEDRQAALKAPTSKAPEEPAKKLEHGPDDKDSRIAQLERLLAERDQEIQAIKDQQVETAELLDGAMKEISSLHNVLDAEDLLVAYQKEVAKVAAGNRALESRLRGLMNENAQIKGLIKFWRGCYDGLAERVKKAIEGDESALAGKLQKSLQKDQKKIEAKVGGEAA